MTDGLFEIRVLVVEDDNSNADIALQMLERLGCEVDHVKDGYQAIYACRNATYDVIFMDCHLPVMDGYEASKKIRQEEADSAERTLIIAFTADAMQYQREKCKQFGMDDYLLKPVSIQDFERLLTLYSKRYKLP